MATPGLPEFTRISKYASYLSEHDRREHWPEQVDRKFAMHEQRYGDRMDGLRDRFNHARQLMLARRVLGSQRALQFGGKPILKHNEKLYNCTVSYADRPRMFQECFFLLLCGCGTGFSVQKHHVARLPAVAPRRAGRKTYVIDDSIEGWADALGALMSSYFAGDVPFPEYQGYRIEFDASEVRPRGAPISSGMKAPGPGPLLRALDNIDRLMAVVASTDGKMRPIHAYDVLMYASDAVLAGGVRRSASIAMFSPDDEEMLMAKAEPGWWDRHPQRQRSNNSAVLLRDGTSYTEFFNLIAMTRRYGEPGFVWCDSTELVVNPCVEIGMWPVWVEEDGTEVSGWQMCNLSTINGAACDTPARFYEAAAAAAFLGTLQAGYATFPYLGEVTEKIVRREALLGVSITGMMEQPDVMFDPEVLATGAQLVKEVNAEVAALIGTNPAARSTCLKPEGTSSCMLDTCSGIHPWHSRRGVRHAQANVDEEPFKHFALFNPHAVLDLAKTDPNFDNTKVIAFPYEVPEHAVTKADVSALDLLQKVILVRQHWVEAGTREELCVQPWLRHNVSNTIHVQDGEWEDVIEFIYDNRAHFAGVALLPAVGDKVYRNAPFMAALTPDEQAAKYGVEAVAIARTLLDLLPTSFDGLWDACDKAERILTIVEPEQATWAGRLIKLADEHFSRDIQRAGFAVKDVYAWDLWCNLRAGYTEVDYATMNEGRDNVDHQAAPACAGGACEVPWL